MLYPVSATIGHSILLILGYAFTGASLKLIDEAFDTDSYNKDKATLLAIPTAAVMAALMISDPPSCAALLAIILAAAVTNKIDNIAFKILVIATLIITAFFPSITLPWAAFATLSIAAIADEYGNDWSDQRKKKPIPNTRQNTLHQILETHLQYRPLLPLTAVILTLTNQLPTTNLIGLITLDLAYQTTNKITHQPKKTQHKTLQKT